MKERDYLEIYGKILLSWKPEKRLIVKSELRNLKVRKTFFY